MRPHALLALPLLALFSGRAAGSPPPVPAPPVVAATGNAPASAVEAGWREMLRDYEKLRDAGTDCLAAFPGFDPEMARLGEAFARNAYPENPDVGRKNFKRLALRLRLSHPDDARRRLIFTPNKEPWPGYRGPVDSGGLAHFLFNSGTFPLPLLDHPLVPVLIRGDISRSRIRPAANCAVRVLRRESADISIVEYDATARAALIAKIRKAFDAENAGAPMTDGEAECLAACLPYMA